jgi:hypothetical protein
MLQKSLCSIAIALLSSFVVRAQQTTASGNAPTAAYAYAKGENTYLMYSAEGYNADKKYVVFKFYKAEDPLSEQEKTDLAAVKKQLAKKNIDVKEVEWKTEEDLRSVLKGYGIQVESSDGKHINLKGDKYSMNTTSTKAVVVLEDGRPVSLCSGKNCEERLKTFFKIKAFI